MSDISEITTQALDAKRALLAELRKQRGARDAAREASQQARATFEHTIALLASEHPDRADWHAFPGPVPRDELLAESGLTVQQLHRLMEKQRRA